MIQQPRSYTGQTLAFCQGYRGRCCTPHVDLLRTGQYLDWVNVPIRPEPVVGVNSFETVNAFAGEDA